MSYKKKVRFVLELPPFLQTSERERERERVEISVLGAKRLDQASRVRI